MNNKKQILILQDKRCDNRHYYCLSNAKFFNEPENITNTNIEKFLNTITTNMTYNNCLSTYYNNSYQVVIDTIIKLSLTHTIPIEKLLQIAQQLSEKNLSSIIQNQHKLNPNYKNVLMTTRGTGNYGSTIYMINVCVQGRKIDLLKSLLDNLPVETFFSVIKNMGETNEQADKIFCDYINKNSQFIKSAFLSDNINFLITKPKILALVYKLNSTTFSPHAKLDLLNKVVNFQTLDPTLILNILEGNEVVPTEQTLTNLLSKVFIRKEVGAVYNKMIAQIISLFVLYGFQITKKIVLILLHKGCYVEQIEKYSIPIDIEILNECSIVEYYPYDFTCVPTEEIMIRECSRENNLSIIKKFKEKGGLITTKCLEKACGVKKNGKVLKYIILECKVKPNTICLENFSSINGTEALDILMKNYSDAQPEVKSSSSTIIDSACSLTVEPKQMSIDKNMEYLLKNKIKKFLNYEKKIIKYNELYGLVLKYLIDKKLIIGNYFVINEQLENLIKINQCTLIHIDQLDNILSYFIIINK